MSSYLADRRKQIGLTQKEVADAVGVSEATVSRWESGEIANMRRDRIAALAKILGCSTDFVMTGNSEGPKIPHGFAPVPETVKLPRAGNIACGTPILAEENIEAYDEVPRMWRADFTLRCKGDSMEPKIKDGDIVAIRSAQAVENGEIAAVCIGDEATLKRVFVFDDHMELRAENPTFATIVLIGEDMNTARIEGKAVGLCRDL